MRTVAGTTLVLAIATGCGGTPGTAAPDAAPTTCSSPGDVPAPRALTERLDLATLVGWSSVEADAQAVNAAGVAPDTDLATVLARVREAADTGGWEPLSLDDEGFEAEFLARDDDGSLLGVNLREATCPGQVLVAVSITDYSSLS